MLHGALEQIGIWLLAATQGNTPVLTRRLWESFSRGHPENIWRLDVSRGVVQLTLGTDVDYATPVEEGHWANPQGVAQRWVPGYWAGDRFIFDPDARTGMLLKQQWIPGYHMFEIAFEQIAPLAPNFIADQLAEVFDDAARRVRR